MVITSCWNTWVGGSLPAHPPNTSDGTSDGKEAQLLPEHGQDDVGRHR